jgi:tetratricopeptide (TPR) repeat protein
MKRIPYISLLIVISSGLFAQNDSDDFKTAYALFITGSHDQASKLAIQYLSDGHDEKEVNSFIGECFQKQGKYEEAIAFYQKSFKQKHEISAYQIAECYAMTGQDYRAVEYLRLYLKTKDKFLQSEIRSNPNFKTIENSKAWLNLWREEHYNAYELKLDEAKYLISKGQEADAFFILDQLIIKDQRRHRALAMRGDLHEKTGNLKYAVRDYEKAVNLNKRNIEYHESLALNYMKAGKYSKAKDIYTGMILHSSHRVDLLKNLVKCEIELKAFEQARQDVDSYMKYFPNDAEAYYLSAKMHSIEGDYIGALEELNVCIAYNPNQYQYYYKRGEVYYQTGMYENSVYDYSMALDLNPEMAEVYYMKGIANLKIDIEEACRDFKKARSMNYHKADDFIIKYCE